MPFASRQHIANLGWPLIFQSVPPRSKSHKLLDGQKACIYICGGFRRWSCGYVLPKPFTTFFFYPKSWAFLSVNRQERSVDRSYNATVCKFSTSPSKHSENCTWRVNAGDDTCSTFLAFNDFQFVRVPFPFKCFDACAFISVERTSSVIIYCFLSELVVAILSWWWIFAQGQDRTVRVLSVGAEDPWGFNLIEGCRFRWDRRQFIYRLMLRRLHRVQKVIFPRVDRSLLDKKLNVFADHTEFYGIRRSDPKSR